MIDEVKIYSYAMTADQVKTEFNMGKSQVMGQDPSRDNDGTTVTGQAAEYCVPGASDPCDPPVLELKMDEKSGVTAYDTSGNGNDGTLGNGTAQYEPVWAKGKYGAGLDFDGADDLVDVASDSSLDLTSAFTLESWVKPDTLPASGEWYDIITKPNAGRDDGNYWIELYNDDEIEVGFYGKICKLTELEFKRTNGNTLWGHLIMPMTH